MPDSLRWLEGHLTLWASVRLSLGLMPTLVARPEEMVNARGGRFGARLRSFH